MNDICYKILKTILNISTFDAFVSCKRQKLRALALLDFFLILQIWLPIRFAVGNPAIGTL